jgi:amino acid transporter
MDRKTPPGSWVRNTPTWRWASRLRVTATVWILSPAYSRNIAAFPHGGGGYVAATKLLGERAGVVSGRALLVDDMLTITTSLATAGDVPFSLLPETALPWKLTTEIAFIVILTWLNLRGVRESVIVLTPIFVVFLVTHAQLIVFGVVLRLTEFGATMSSAKAGFDAGLTTLGAGGMGLLFHHAYSIGGGTFTGIEAVSNGLEILREPRVATAKRTMLSLAASLALLSAGLLLCYLLWKVGYTPGKTRNFLLTDTATQGFPIAQGLGIVTLAPDAAILVVSAQAGFLDGPRVLANMALDSWVPHGFGALSERLTTQGNSRISSSSRPAPLTRGVSRGATNLTRCARTRRRIFASTRPSRIASASPRSLTGLAEPTSSTKWRRSAKTPRASIRAQRSSRESWYSPANAGISASSTTKRPSRSRNGSFGRG